MSVFFSTAIAMQREILQAQKAQMTAARKALGAGDAMIAMHEATQAAAEANVKAWKAWSKLWGWR